MPRTPVTYSRFALFRNCRKAYYWRYERGLVPRDVDRNLAFGKVIAQALHVWHARRSQVLVSDLLRECYPLRVSDPEQKRAWQVATAMMLGYARRWPEDERMEILGLEQRFERQIINPKTGAQSRSFTLQGKADALVKLNGAIWLKEDKTASVIDGSYLDRLWTDFQTTLYAHSLAQSLGITIEGVLYNILAKSKLQQSAGETEQEYEARVRELTANNTSGKPSRAKRRMPETDEAFLMRLAEWYSRPEAFHRERLLISGARYDELCHELWELTQALLDAQRRNQWYQNTDFCFRWNRSCDYYPLCRSGSTKILADNLYVTESANSELQEDARVVRILGNSNQREEKTDAPE